jgi:transposase
MVEVMSMINTSLHKLNNSMENKYYVYGLYEEGVELPFYIGKGSGRRIKRYSLDDKRKIGYLLQCKFKNLKNLGKKLDRKILHENLSEDDALQIEMDLIKKYGKRCDNTGILFNFTDGGDQPPSVDVFRMRCGEERYKEMREKANASFKQTAYTKNFDKILKVEELLKENLLIKEIAEIVGVHRMTVGKWIKTFNLKYDDTKKRILEIERLQSFHRENSKKIPKTAKKYLIIYPDGSDVWVNKMVIFCNENGLDYRSLRNTFSKNRKCGTPHKCKGFWIKEVIEPND